MGSKDSPCAMLYYSEIGNESLGRDSLGGWETNRE
jgi:hypothetical protein